MTVVELGWWGVPIGVVGGAIRVSTPFLFVSLGECITEKSGRINLGLEGILVMGAMSGYAVSYLSGSPWLGVLAAGGVKLHALATWWDALEAAQKHKYFDERGLVETKAFLEAPEQWSANHGGRPPAPRAMGR